MKLWLLAFITGLALAAALLGLTVERTHSAQQQPPLAEFPPIPVPAASDNSMSENQHLQGPAAHGDGNRAAEEYLNGNVINGQTTTICAEDKALHEALTTATQAWNQALDNLAGGSVLTNHPNTYLLTALDPVTGLPIEQTVTDCRGMDVEVLRRTDRSRPSLCRGEGWGAAACYASKRASTPRPRREFNSPDNDDPDTMPQPYGIIYYQASDISHATLVHELGHVLGLSDYLTCDELRAGPDKSTGLTQPGDVDLLDDHFSVMRNDRTAVCRSGGAITGRDLRDFYETYRVGAITAVRLDGNVASNTNGHLSITFYWGSSGVEQASHNGSHVAVLRRADSSAAWTSVGIGKTIWTSQSQAREMLSVVDTLGRAAEYKIVGLTRGDIRRQTEIDTHGTFTVEGDTEGAAFTDEFTEGDPTVIVGVTPYRESGAKRVEVDGPAVLSATASPRYCDVNGTLTVTMLSSGGGTSAEESTKGPNSSFAKENRVSCGTNPGGQLVSVKAEWGTGSQAVARTTELPIQVHATPRRATRIATTLVPRPLANPVSVTSCVTGETLSLAVEPKSLLAHLDVWVNDRRLTAMSTSMECRADSSGRSRMRVMVFRSDGGRLGDLTLRILGEFRPRFLDRQLYCKAGDETTANLVITGGQAGYSYSDKLQSGTIRTPTSRGYYAYAYDCPAVPVRGESVQVAVRDASGRSRTASVPLDACVSPLPKPATPTPAANGVDSFAIALEWDPVPCARGYEVRYEAIDSPGGGEVISSLLTGASVDTLRANTVYRISVRAMETQRLMEIFAASEWSEWVSVQTAPAAPSLKVDFRSWAGDSGGSYGVDVSWPQVPGATTYSDVFDVSPGEVTAARIGTSQAPSCGKGDSDVELICQNLAPDQTYEIEVRAVNSNGDASEPGTAVACLGPCGVRVSQVSTSGLLVSWTGLEPYRGEQQSVVLHEARVLLGDDEVATKRGSHQAYARLSNLSLTGETTYTVEVRLRSIARGGWTGWVGVEFTTPAAPKPDPLTLTVTPSATTCLTGGTVTLSWSVKGGSGKYAVSVDGAKQTGASASVTCRATAGEQSVTVVATDTVHAMLTDSQTLTLTVTNPKVEAPTGLSVDAEVTKLTLTWEGPDAATGYGVRIDGGAETKLPAKTKSYPFTGLTPSTKYELEVRAYVDDDDSLWSSIEESTLSPPPLVLTAQVEPTSCETNAQVTVSWTVTGGSDSHAVSVDGKPQSGASFKLTCQATAGTQSVTVKATDTTYPQLTATQTLSLTVTKPAPPATVTAQIRARRLSDNRVEFRLRLADGTVETTANRYIKLPEITAGRWYSSSAFTTTIDSTDYTLGVVSARLDNTVCPALVEVTFIPTGGERITPTQYKLPVNRASDLWAATSKFAVPLKPTSTTLQSAQSDAGYQMVEAPEGAKDGPGREGGLMLGDASDAVDSAQAGDAQATCTDQPTGLQTSNITSSGVRLSWQAVSGASQYDVSVGGGAEQALASTQRSYDFTGLAADTDHTLRVRARGWRGSSEWSSKTIRTTVSSVPVVTITGGASPIDEGDNASFTVASDRAPATALTVKLSITESGAMINGTPPTQVTIAAGARTATVTVATTNDSQDEPNSVITAKLVAGSGYRPGSPSSAAVTVSDDDSQASALTLTISASPTGCETGGEVTVSWTVTGGSGSHTVTVDGTARSGSSTKLTCQATAGTQMVTVKATDQTHTHLTATETLALTVTDPVTLTISASPTGCGTGDEVTVSWTVSGGSGSHTVTVDGDAQAGSSAKVACQATAGTQMVTVKATDQTHTHLTATETLTLTVTDPVTLTATASPTGCETGGEVTVSWTVTGGSGSHTVTVDGTARSGSSTKVACQATAGTQTVTMKATDKTHTQLTATKTLTLTVTDPITLTTSASPTSCETGGEVTVSWTAAGGSGSHTVTVDGDAQTGSSTKVACQATAGMQTVAVKATDKTYTKRSATKTLTLTVTKPAPPSTVEAKLWARRLSDNRIELALRLADGKVIRPDSRFANPATMTNLAWKNSETLSVTIDDHEYTLGRISARLQNDRCPSLVEVGFLPTSGARLLPGLRFIKTNSTVNAWRSSAAFEITLVAPASDSLVDATDDQKPAGDWLDDTPDATNAGPGTDGGPMSAEAPSNEQVERARSEAQSNVTPVCPLAPGGLSASDVQTDRITLSWTAVSGASQYDVQRDGVSIGSVTTNSIESTGLRPNRSYSFRVRVRDAWGASSWSNRSVTSLPLAPVTPSGLQATATTDSLTLTWSSALRATGYQVRLESGSAKSPSNPPRRHTFGGLNPDKQYRLYVRATNRGGQSTWALITGTTKPRPISLSAMVQPTSCEVGESVTVEWSVSGGSGSYSVTVGEVAKTGTSAKLTCQETAGTQTIAVVATDTKHPTLSDTQNLSVTVKSPPTVTGQIAARLLSSGKIELAFRPTGGSRIPPRLRIYTPDTTKLTKWTTSSAVIGPAGTEKNRLLGNITVKHIKTTSSYYVDVCFRPAGASQRICPPKNNFYYKTATVDRWLYTGTITFKPLRVSALSVDSAQDGAADAQMQPIADGEADSVGAEGGLMSDEE